MREATSGHPLRADGGQDAPLEIRAPERSHLDEAITVTVTGARPGESVTLTATLVDDDGTEWRSETAFVADTDGVVDLSARAPESGSYEGVAPMGWCWAMESASDRPTATLGARAERPVTLRASTASRETTRTITRQVYDEGITARQVAADDLVGTWYEPATEGPHPGVVTLHGSGGRRSDRTAKQLATRGIATLALSYVGEAEAIPDRLSRVPLSSVERAAAWLRGREAVADRRVGLFGVSRGGELALLVGARSDDIGAVVSYAGSGVVFDTPDGTPAWVDDGEPVPCLSGVGEPERTPSGEVVTRPVLERGLAQAGEAERRAATIPVEQIAGPVLLASGSDDQVWPARRLSTVAAERLSDHDFDHEWTHLTDDEVGHLISVPYVPLGGFDRGGGRPGPTARLGAEAWTTALAYFTREA